MPAALRKNVDEATKAALRVLKRLEWFRGQADTWRRGHDPWYVEEVLRPLIDRGSIEREMSQLLGELGKLDSALRDCGRKLTGDRPLALGGQSGDSTHEALLHLGIRVAAFVASAYYHCSPGRCTESADQSEARDRLEGRDPLAAHHHLEEVEKVWRRAEDLVRRRQTGQEGHQIYPIRERETRAALDSLIHPEAEEFWRGWDFNLVVRLLRYEYSAAIPPRRWNELTEKEQDLLRVFLHPPHEHPLSIEAICRLAKPKRPSNQHSRGTLERLAEEAFLRRCGPKGGYELVRWPEGAPEVE